MPLNSDSTLEAGTSEMAQADQQFIAGGPASDVLKKAGKSRHCLWIVLLVVGLMGGGYAAWEGYLKGYFVPRHWEMVEDGAIYRSGTLSSWMVKKTWQKYNIKVVVNLGRDKEGNSAHDAALTAARELGIDRRTFRLDGDGTGNVESYVLAVEAVIQAKRDHKPVAVNCSTGTYRTGGVIALYHVLAEGWSGQAAYRELVDNGVDNGPSAPIFSYLNKNIGKVAQRLVADGFIEKAPDPLPVFAP